MPSVRCHSCRSAGYANPQHRDADLLCSHRQIVAIANQQPCRNQHGAPVLEDRVHGRRKRRLDDHASQLRMRRGELKREVRAQVLAVEHNRACANVPRCRQVVERTFGILPPVGLAGPGKLALPITAIVEGQHIHACSMQPRQRAGCVAEISVLAVQKKNGEAVRRSRGLSGNPPSPETWCPFSGGREPNRLKREAHLCRGGCNRCMGMVKQLPAPLPEEQAQRAPGAKCCGGDRARYRKKQPPA